eukprot:superscaffoldBa00006245_g21298
MKVTATSVDTLRENSITSIRLINRVVEEVYAAPSQSLRASAEISVTSGVRSLTRSMDPEFLLNASDNDLFEDPVSCPFGLHHTGFLVSILH